MKKPKFEQTCIYLHRIRSKTTNEFYHETGVPLDMLYYYGISNHSCICSDVVNIYAATVSIEYHILWLIRLKGDKSLRIRTRTFKYS